MRIIENKSIKKTKVHDKEEDHMRKHIIGENGISYTLGKDGMYYPDLKLPEGTNYQIGR